MDQKKVFTNGCFDVLHRGHIELLKFCKTFGSVVVGLNSDLSVKRLKGKQRPINNQEDRKFILSSLKFVDDVIIFDTDTPYDLIKSLKPDLIVKGGDYQTNDVVGADICEVKIFKFMQGYSSSSVISKIDLRSLS
jgi:D-beta-D-heptose 7-phosphate kinase/D-beta-D-heptose 1-phosphate adenosyltransferase